jgi:hypothetical protein
MRVSCGIHYPDIQEVLKSYEVFVFEYHKVRLVIGHILNSTEDGIEPMVKQ